MKPNMLEIMQMLCKKTRYQNIAQIAKINIFG